MISWHGTGALSRRRSLAGRAGAHRCSTPYSVEQADADLRPRRAVVPYRVKRGGFWAASGAGAFFWAVGVQPLLRNSWGPKTSPALVGFYTLEGRVMLRIAKCGAAFSHLPLLLVSTYLRAEASFNKFNGLPGRPRVAEDPLLTRRDHALSTDRRNAHRKERRIA